MVYLVRTSTYVRFNETVEEKSAALFAHIRETYPEIRDMKAIWNVTGAINEVHWVLSFESLADEDEWAGKIIRDEAYMNWFSESEGYVTPGVDRLFRDAPSL